MNAATDEAERGARYAHLTRVRTPSSPNDNGPLSVSITNGGSLNNGCDELRPHHKFRPSRAIGSIFESGRFSLNSKSTLLLESRLSYCEQAPLPPPRRILLSIIFDLS